MSYLVGIVGVGNVSHAAWGFGRAPLDGSFGCQMIVFDDGINGVVLLLIVISLRLFLLFRILRCK